MRFVLEPAAVFLDMFTDSFSYASMYFKWRSSSSTIRFFFILGDSLSLTGLVIIFRFGGDGDLLTFFLGDLLFIAFPLPLDADLPLVNLC